MKQGIVADFVAEDRGRGFEVLSNTIRPAKKNNVSSFYWILSKNYRLLLRIQ